MPDLPYGYAIVILAGFFLFCWFASHDKDKEQ